MEIIKSAGLTASELYLAGLCEHSFLKLWSYPNVFRNQGRKNGGDGKELCDLLVVCGNDVIIFSDKSCQIPDTGNADTDWCRWFRKAIKKSADQIYGAERWLKQYPNTIYLDSKCTTPFPLKIPEVDQLRIHRVVVALGAKLRCQQELRGSGSLWLSPHICGNDHMATDSETYRRFHLGRIEPGKDFVHVFDDVTLDVILKELDTITDFLTYLNWKEDFITSDNLSLSKGEENLLGAYLTDINEDAQHDIIIPEGYSQVVVEKYVWDSVRKNPQYLRKKKSDQVSYLWDQIIDSFADHVLKGTILGDPHYTIDDHESILRIVAKESRLQRRMLAASFIEAVEIGKKSPQSAFWRTTFSQQKTDFAYVFGLIPHKYGTYEEYREVRKGLLSSYCKIVAYKSRDFRTVFGIATSKDPASDNSFDFVVFDSPEIWTIEMERDAHEVQNQLGLLQESRLSLRSSHGNEYPEPMIHVPSLNRKIGRNEKCPCGSGVKYKKCCGRK